MRILCEVSGSIKLTVSSSAVTTSSSPFAAPLDASALAAATARISISVTSKLFAPALINATVSLMPSGPELSCVLG
jgi:hypothetical protein|tara:strand:+ start:848 stop:1075 length:228 start_codon:yes stop_codon:yes gene_type:complete